MERYDERFDRRPPPAAASVPPVPPPRRALRPVRRGLDAGALAQDYRHYAWADYERRRRSQAVSWRDVYPAYVFARTSHSADWPRGGDEQTDAGLAVLWEQARGASRWSWARARPVVEDAWLALDHMPSAAVHPPRT